MPPQGSVPYSPVPTVEPQGGGGGFMSAKASPADFGADIAKAEQGFGETLENIGEKGIDLATKYQRQVTEAKANDAIVNEWTPKAAELRNNFDQLPDNEKAGAYDSYLGAVRGLQTKMLEGRGEEEKQILSQYTNNHLISETNYARKSQVEALNKFEGDSFYKRMSAQKDYAAQNYNDPFILQNINDDNDALITTHFIDNGYDPRTEEGSAVISNAQREARGEVAVGAIDQAIKSNDVGEAYRLRSQYAPDIPGYKQNQLDSVLRVQSLQQHSVATMSALKGGQPIPDVVGVPPSRIQAMVASAAHRQGVNPNIALAYGGMESTWGTDLGDRGTFQQDELGGTEEEQAERLPGQIKKNDQVASNALGRAALPWEGYLVHQQGVGGGPALLKADKNASAVDVLAPLYKSRQEAESAIVGNGGQANMTVGDFTSFIKKKFELCQKQSNCDFGDKDPGEAIGGSATATAPVLQPTATPFQALREFEDKSASYFERINAIPNNQVREAALEAFKKDKATYEAAAKSYVNTLHDQAKQLAIDPSFTSMDQVPSELLANLATDSPETIKMLQVRADYNTEHSAGAVTKDDKEYGTKYFELFKAVHAPPGDPNHISNVSQLYASLNNGLTVSGLDKLTKELSGAGTPEGAAEGKMREQTFKVIKNYVSGEDAFPGMKDPKGEQIYAHALPILYKALEDGQAKGIPAGELYDPENKNWIGNSVKGLRRTPEQWNADLAAANIPDNPDQASMEKDLTAKFDSGDLKGADGLEAIKNALNNKEITRETANRLAIAYGYARPSEPKVITPLIKAY